MKRPSRLTIEHASDDELLAALHSEQRHERLRTAIKQVNNDDPLLMQIMYEVSLALELGEAQN